MRRPRFLEIVLAVLCLLTPCMAHHMAVITDKENKTENIGSAQLAKLFKGEVTKWPDGRSVILVVHTSSAGEVDTLAHLMKTTHAEVKAALFGHKESIRTVESDADLVDAVASTPGAIGMVEEHSITDRVKVIKVDGKLPMEAGYLPH